MRASAPPSDERGHTAAAATNTHAHSTLYLLQSQRAGESTGSAATPALCAVSRCKAPPNGQAHLSARAMARARAQPPPQAGCVCCMVAAHTPPGRLMMHGAAPASDATLNERTWHQRNSAGRQESRQTAVLPRGHTQQCWHAATTSSASCGLADRRTRPSRMRMSSGQR
jgi:hypothetical protein